MSKLIAGCLMLMLSAGVSGPAGAEAQMGAVKNAGKAVTETTQDVGKATVNTTEKGAKATKKTVTGKAHATCVDGTRQAGDTEAAAAAACAKHGGVAKR
jgi:hypothetical protein